MTNLIPRQPKRKRQPTASMYREQLALAADEIIRIKALLPYADDPITVLQMAGDVARRVGLKLSREDAKQIERNVEGFYPSRPWPKTPEPPKPPPSRVFYQGFPSFMGSEEEFEKWKAKPWWRRWFS